MEEITANDLADPDRFIQFGNPPVAIGILCAIDGVDFDTAWPRRVIGVIDQATGDRANFISREDLIASRLAAGRHAICWTSKIFATQKNRSPRLNVLVEVEVPDGAVERLSCCGALLLERGQVFAQGL